MCFQVPPKAFQLDNAMRYNSGSDFQTVGPATEKDQVPNGLVVICAYLYGLRRWKPLNGRLGLLTVYGY